jgi:hypothetical protein
MATRQGGAAGEHYDARTNSWVPDTFKVTRTASAMRGVGAYDSRTIKDGLGKRLLDRLIK